MTAADRKEIRRRAGLSAEALARLLGVSGGSLIRRWERSEQISGPIDLLYTLLNQRRLDHLIPAADRMLTADRE